MMIQVTQLITTVFPKIWIKDDEVLESQNQVSFNWSNKCLMLHFTSSCAYSKGILSRLWFETVVGNFLQGGHAI